MARSKRPAMPAYPHEIAAQRRRVEESEAAAAANPTIEPGREAQDNKDDMRAAASSGGGSRTPSDSKSSGRRLTTRAGRGGAASRGGRGSAAPHGGQGGAPPPGGRRGAVPVVSVALSVGGGRSWALLVRGAPQPPQRRGASEPLVFCDVEIPSLMESAVPVSLASTTVAPHPSVGYLTPFQVASSVPPPHNYGEVPPPPSAGCMLPYLPPNAFLPQQTGLFMPTPRLGAAVGPELTSSSFRLLLQRGALLYLLLERGCRSLWQGGPRPLLAFPLGCSRTSRVVCRRGCLFPICLLVCRPALVRV